MIEERGIPITVVTGFLGAGKTTLVNALLAAAPRGEIAVIVNEHGAVGIDAALLAARVETIVEIAGGCVCCSTRAELARALESFARSPSPPARILVETSGAASPAGVLHVVRGSERARGTFLDGVVTVVDASRMETLAEHELAVEQIGYADIVVASRADLCDDTARARARDAIEACNGAAFVTSAARGAFEDPSLTSLDALLARRGADLEPARAAWGATAPAAHPYESVALVHEGDVDGERFADFVETEVARFSGRLFRTKGILAVDGIAERMIVQGVADDAEISFGEPWGDVRRRSTFVVVGYGLDRASLERAFAACHATTPSRA
ncbi:MAG: GTP-binding protein [Deltaproteobacteria bacterium]|nr:GTP-binding protein [Deltaproteobacteria bacterium]